MSPYITAALVYKTIDSLIPSEF